MAKVWMDWSPAVQLKKDKNMKRLCVECCQTLATEEQQQQQQQQNEKKKRPQANNTFQSLTRKLNHWLQIINFDNKKSFLNQVVYLLTPEFGKTALKMKETQLFAHLALCFCLLLKRRGSLKKVSH